MRTHRCRNYGLMAALVMTIVLVMSTAAVFADEEESGKVNVQITVSEHGSVNGNAESYSEEIARGEDLILECESDEGYVIGTVLINDMELEEEDLEGIAGETHASLTLEELEEDLSVAVSFTEGIDDSEGEDGDGAGSEADPGDDETGSGDGETDPGAEEPSDTDPADQQESLDPADEGDDETGTETADEPSDPASDETEDDAAGNDEKDGNGSDQTTDPADKDTAKAAAGVSGSSSSPKTGDSLPAAPFLLLLGSLSGMGGLGIHQLMKRIKTSV